MHSCAVYACADSTSIQAVLSVVLLKCAVVVTTSCAKTDSLPKGLYKVDVSQVVCKPYNCSRIVSIV